MPSERSPRHYVFGFGSLINRASRFVTLRRHSEAVPVVVKGLRRAWSARVPVYRMTALGVAIDPRGHCNGVVFPTDARGLALLDKREIAWTRGQYRRVLLHPRRFGIRPRLPAGARVWCYVPKRHEVPDEQCPIAQTYVDIVMYGCASFGDGFAREFLKSTHGWSGPWIEDRATLRYPRYRRSPAEHAAVDRIIGDVLPAEFARRIPGA